MTFRLFIVIVHYFIFIRHLFSQLFNIHLLPRHLSVQAHLSLGVAAAGLVGLRHPAEELRRLHGAGRAVVSWAVYGVWF